MKMNRCKPGKGPCSSLSEWASGPADPSFPDEASAKDLGILFAQFGEM
jgi:hypothetical protein